MPAAVSSTNFRERIFKCDKEYESVRSRRRRRCMMSGVEHVQQSVQTSSNFPITACFYPLVLVHSGTIPSFFVPPLSSYSTSYNRPFSRHTSVKIFHRLLKNHLVAEKFFSALLSLNHTLTTHWLALTSCYNTGSNSGLISAQ